MKNARVFMSAFVIFAIVGSALAFNSKKGQGNLYCTDLGTTCSGRVDFLEFSPGDGSKPCGSTAGVANPVYKAIPSDCVVAAGPFIGSASGN